MVGLSMIGKSISHYRITEKLGAGGMGEVYRATDTKLGRDVAIKVIPEAFSRDADRMARFAREAKVLAALNHPNIAAIYGLEESALVMELVEGPTLAEHIAPGPIPVEEALPIARQIAAAVEYAHERGIIHRDLKPANVKLTADGQVKVLDFGLAKAQESAAGNAEDSHTLTVSATREGTILGTAAYMSPEQASGKPVDRRADIWSFGVVLWELLTGHRLFEGETVSHTLAEVLRGPIDFDQLPRETPAAIRGLLRRCLDRDVKNRLRDIGEARITIDATLAGEMPLLEVVPEPGGARRLWLAWSVAAVATVGLATVAFLHFRERPPAPVASVITSTIKVEPGHWLDGMRLPAELERPSRTAMAISSDGRFIVYSAIGENPGPQAKPQLYLRRMDQAEAKPISGTEGGINPFLSPDNRWVGFWADGKLKKVPVDGGVPDPLCDAGEIYGASWGPDNSIVFAGGYGLGLSRVSADGGKPESPTTPDPKRKEYSHRQPSWLPNGRAVLFTVMKHAWDSQPWLALLRLDTREWHVLLPNAADARYVPTGHLVFLRQGTLMAVRFDPARLEVIGQPFPLVENVMQDSSAGGGYNTVAGQFDVSDSGALIYAAGGILPDTQNSLVWVDQNGIEQSVTPLQMPFLAPRLSPNGQRITYVTMGREAQVYVYDLNTSTNSPLTTEGRAHFPIWSPDGKRIVFSWQESAVPNLFSQPYDGSSSMERLTTSEYYQFPGSWWSDGQTLALVESHPATGFDIVLLETRSESVRPFLNSQFNEAYPELSPDGRWIAYTSNESARNEVYVRPFPGPGMKHPVSSQGGREPLWARNGKQLFYRWQDQVWAVDVRTDGGFTTSKPRLLFERPGYSPATAIRGYDLSQDGQRFLMVKLEQRKPTPVTEMILVQNWFEELKRLAPAGK
jgi:serine/threonine-protein kinase